MREVQREYDVAYEVNCCRKVPKSPLDIFKVFKTHSYLMCEALQ